MDDRKIDQATVEAVSNRVRQAAIDTFGEKLEKVYLYDVNPGGTDDPDLSFLVVAHVPQIEANRASSKITSRTAYLGLEYDVLHYCQVTGSEIFNTYKTIIADYVNATTKGTLLYG